ncbi:MAG TPA: hypothetical protein VD929_08765 [Caulobacteraceae bacterium]|nr:hypothetical protein [Caulobacteraceae bacterium]
MLLDQDYALLRKAETESSARVFLQREGEVCEDQRAECRTASRLVNLGLLERVTEGKAERSVHGDVWFDVRLTADGAAMLRLRRRLDAERRVAPPEAPIAKVGRGAVKAAGQVAAMLVLAVGVTTTFGPLQAAARQMIAAVSGPGEAALAQAQAVCEGPSRLAQIETASFARS